MCAALMVIPRAFSSGALSISSYFLAFALPARGEIWGATRADHQHVTGRTVRSVSQCSIETVSGHSTDPATREKTKSTFFNKFKTDLEDDFINFNAINSLFGEVPGIKSNFPEQDLRYKLPLTSTRLLTFWWQDFGDSCCEGRLAVVHMTNGTNIHMGLVALENLLSAPGRYRPGSQSWCAGKRTDVTVSKTRYRLSQKLTVACILTSGAFSENVTNTWAGNNETRHLLLYRFIT